MTIGDIIREKRKKSFMTQEQLHEKSGVATITIRQYENAKRQPKIEQLQKIADAFGIPVSALLQDVDSFALQEVEQETLPDDYRMEGEEEAEIALREQEPKMEEMAALSKAKEAADEVYLTAVRSISETYLINEIRRIFNYLNRRGKFQACELMRELLQNPRFNNKGSD